MEEVEFPDFTVPMSSSFKSEHSGYSGFSKGALSSKIVTEFNLRLQFSDIRPSFLPSPQLNGDRMTMFDLAKNNGHKRNQDLIFAQLLLILDILDIVHFLEEALAKMVSLNNLFQTIFFLSF
jgi:hypothetical protein